MSSPRLRGGFNDLRRQSRLYIVLRASRERTSERASERANGRARERCFHSLIRSRTIDRNVTAFFPCEASPLTRVTQSVTVSQGHFSFFLNDKEALINVWLKLDDCFFFPRQRPNIKKCKSRLAENRPAQKYTGGEPVFVTVNRGHPSDSSHI